jgi:hypothetical protein
MNSGIIRKALITTLALELEYRSHLRFARLKPNPNGPQNFNIQGDCLKMSLPAS